jgi:uncharacterized YigZ family protein
MPDFYYTIKTTSEGLFKEKGSKFIARAYPVKTEEEIKDILSELRKNYHDARHHCYAWVLGADREIFRANDDGEPANSAGKPILAQLDGHNLTNILVVVIRYFGGTLLGIGGLINAYRKATKDALKKSQIIKEYIQTSYRITFDYPDMNIVMKKLKDLDALVFEQKFELKCMIKTKIRRINMESFEKSFEPYPGIKILRIQDD